VGLSNTRARLQQLYGAAHQFHLSNGADGGLAVDIVMPLRRAAPDGSKT
jgi:sensor histidine kinase YesM